MQKKQNPAARLRGAEVHLSRAMALRSWHHTTTSGLRKRTGVIIAGGIDNQNLAGLLMIRARQPGRAAASFATGMTTEISGGSLVGILLSI